MTPPSELVAAVGELDELISSETVRARHVRLVRIRALVELALHPATALDNVITPESDHAQ